MAAAWFVLWVTAIGWLIGAWRPALDAQLGYWLGGIAIALLIVCGYLLARANRWAYLLALIPYVALLVVMLYGLAWQLPEPGHMNTSAAGAGAAILGIATGFVVTVFVGLGAGTAWLVTFAKARE